MPTTYVGANVYRSAITIPSDGDAENAASVNVPLEALADGVSYLLPTAGLNWGASVDIVTPFSTIAQYHATNYYNQIAPPAWDPYIGRWVVAWFDNGGTGGLRISVSYDGGSSWTSLAFDSGGINHPSWVTVNPTTGIIVVGCPAQNVWYVCTPTGTLNVYTPLPVANTLVQAAYFNGYTVAFAFGVAYYYTYGANTWASSTGGLPVNVGAISAQSPSVLILMPSAPNPANYAYSTDGITFTSAAFGVAFGAGYYVSGATYDATNGTFLLVVTNDTNTQLYKSSTGAANTWTSVGGLVPHAAYALACKGQEKVLAMVINGSTRLMQSMDGGVTWHFTRSPTFPSTLAYVATAGSGATQETGMTLACNGSQFFALMNFPTSSSGAGNGAYTTSFLIGLGPQLTF